MLIKPRATIEDLYNVPDNGKAEIVNGEIVRMSPAGGMPGRAATKIAAGLMRHEEESGSGYAFGDNVGFEVDLPHRGSFSPDAAWYTGNVESMRFLPGAPAFAVEVRSESDYGPAAERAIRDKIAEYFAAGAQVVWDVDLLDQDVIKIFRRDAPAQPSIHGRGEFADAEPAVPGWQFSVDILFS